MDCLFVVRASAASTKGGSTIFDLDARQTRERDQCRELAERSRGASPRETLRALAAAGAPWVPSSGRGALDVCVAMHSFFEHARSTDLLATWVGHAAHAYVALSGMRESARRGELLDALATADRIGGGAFRDGAALDASAPPLVYEPVDDARGAGLGLRGSAALAAGSETPDVVVLAASGAAGLQLLHVAMADLRPSRAQDGSIRLALDGVRLSSDAVIATASVGRDLLQTVATWSRVCTAAAWLGVSHGALAALLEHVTTTSRYGRPLRAFEGARARAVDIALELDVGRELTYRAARAIDAGDAHAWEHAARARAFVTDHVPACLHAAATVCSPGDGEAAHVVADAHRASVTIGWNEVPPYVLKSAIAARWLGLRT